MKNSIKLQEELDEQVSHRIMGKLYNDNLNWLVRDDYSYSDVLYSGYTKPHTLEIKSTSKAMYDGGISLKFKKLIDLRYDRDKRNHKERLILIFLDFKTSTYYIFDLDKIDYTDCEWRNLPIKQTQYSSTSKTISTPCVIIPTSMAIKTGDFYLTDEDEEKLYRIKQLIIQGL